MAALRAMLNRMRQHGDQREDAGSEAPVDTVTFFFDFRGRINRARYWLALLIFLIVDVVLSLIGLAVGKGLTFQVVSYGLNLAMFLSTIALSIKRLHDRDRSAWWLLSFYIVPALIVAVGGFLLWNAAGSFGDVKDVSLLLLRVCVLGGVAFCFWGLAEIGFRRGTTGYNRFGPDPLARRSRTWVRPAAQLGR